MNTLQHKIVEFLKPILEERNITYAQLAHALNLTEWKVKEIFSCRTSLTVENLKRILEILDLPLEIKIDNVIIRMR